MKQKMKLGRKILSVALMVAMVIGVMPGMSLTALAIDETTDRSWKVNEDTTISLSEATAEKVIGSVSDNTIKMVLIGTLGGTISNLPATGGTITTKVSSDNTAAMVHYDAAQSNETIKSMLKDIKFTSGTTQVHIDVTTGDTTDSISNDFDATNVTFGILNSNGEAHAYKYIAFEANNQTDWIHAYDNAVNGGDSLGGLKGYLATVTTRDEANILHSFYTSITTSTQGAWIAGTSLKHSADSNLTYDTAEKITPDNYSAGTSGSVTSELKIETSAGAYYCPLSGSSTTSGTYAPYYYWACGPEQGDQVPAGLWASGEPNNSDSGNRGEYCAVSSWSNAASFNDLSPFNNVGGYFLEFSVYADGIADGTQYNSTTIYKLTFDGNDATSGTAPAPQEKIKDTDLTIAANTGDLEKTGYVFSGWNTRPDGSGTDYAAGGTYSSDSSAMLYAKWVPLATPATISPNNRTYDGTEKPLVSAEDDAVGGTMQYVIGTDDQTAPTTGWDAAIPAATDAGTYYVWYKAAADTDHVDSEPACVVATIRGLISKTITFKVANGSWNDGTTENKTVSLSGGEGDTLVLKAGDVPAVGNKPGEGYQAGSWDVVPRVDTPITADTTYIYTYAKAPVEKGELTIIAKDQTITFGNQIKTGASAYEIKGLKAGDKAKVTLKADMAAFTITPSVTVKNSGKDVTANYDITSVAGKLTVKGVPMIKAISKGKGITVTWDKVAAADGYDIYAAYCGKSAKFIKTVKGNKTSKYTYKKLNGKKLNLKKPSKVFVKAYKMIDGKKVTLQSSIFAHVAGVNDKTRTNAKSVKLTKSKFTLAKGKTANLNAKVTLVNKNKKQLSEGHTAEIRYTSSNKRVATVDSKGKITAVGSGTCTVYVSAVDGAYKKAKVTVK